MKYQAFFIRSNIVKSEEKHTNLFSALYTHILGLGELCCVQVVCPPECTRGHLFDTPSLVGFSFVFKKKVSISLIYP